MRHILFATVFLAASPALAEVIEISAAPVAVTLYPQNASITRRAAQDLPAGIHQIVIPGLPPGTDPNSLRVNAEGVTLGTFSLQTARPLPEGLAELPAVTAARDEVYRLERELRMRDAAVEAIRAEILVADDMATYLKWLATSDGAATGDVAGLTDFVETRVTEARRNAIDAESRAQAAEQGREQDQRALDAARQRLAALESPNDGRLTLVLNVESPGGPAGIEITSVAQEAGWRPVYDLRLTEAEKALTLDRGLMVSQRTGEDWRGVRLTLSTARPSGQSGPSELFTQVLRAYDPMNEPPAYASPVAPTLADGVMHGGGSIESNLLRRGPSVAYQGSVVVYDYETPVDLRSGADELRLSLDQVALPVEALVAEAVPSRDSSAYLVADSKNALEEVILPGQATLYADGGMVGLTQLPLTPAGDDMKLGFGAIDGIVLERRVPERAEGGRGMIRRDTALEETVILSAKNLTGRDYELRLIDQVPISEQEELKITWTASIEPSETDPEGERGLLVWTMPLAAGQTQEITLESSIRWPEGKVIE